MAHVIDGEKDTWSKYIIETALTIGQRDKMQQWLGAIQKARENESKNTEPLLLFIVVSARLLIRGLRKEWAKTLIPYFNSVIFGSSLCTSNLIISTPVHYTEWRVINILLGWLPQDQPLSGWSLWHLIPRLLPAACVTAPAPECSLEGCTHALSLRKWE